MSLRHSPRLIPVLLLAAAGLTSPAVAQAPDPPTREEIARADAFRAEFFQLVDVLQEIATLVNDANRYQRLEEARGLMRQAAPEGIATLLRRGAPPLRPAIRANLKLRTLLAERAKSAPKAVEPSTPGLPGRPPILADCNNIAHDSAFTFGALIAVQVADTALAAAGRVCDEVIVAAGFGGNTALVCLPLEIALTAAKIPFALADFCGGEEDSSFLEGSFDRLEHIHGDLEGSVANDNTNRDLVINNSNTNTANIIANDNTNTTNIINNDNTNRDLIINNANQNLAQLVAEIRGLGCEIVRLLNTPEGRRASSILACTGQPGFPYNFPEPPLQPGAWSVPKP
jgi:hypothetical protein